MPPNQRQATGLLTATFDTATRILTWSGSYSGLTSKITGIHFHSPARPNDTAGVVMSIKGFSGSATLTDAQAADLVAGYWYVDIHTRASPRGEIRGQLVRGQ